MEVAVSGESVRGCAEWGAFEKRERVPNRECEWCSARLSEYEPWRDLCNLCARLKRRGEVVLSYVMNRVERRLELCRDSRERGRVIEKTVAVSVSVLGRGRGMSGDHKTLLDHLAIDRDVIRKRWSKMVGDGSLKQDQRGRWHVARFPMRDTDDGLYPPEILYSDYFVGDIVPLLDPELNPWVKNLSHRMPRPDGVKHEKEVEQTLSLFCIGMLGLAIGYALHIVSDSESLSALLNELIMWTRLAVDSA